MKKILSTIAVGMCLSVGLEVGAEPVDINRHWAREAINYLEEERVMFSSQNRFRPDDNITRAEFMNAINNNFGYTEKKESYFKDVRSTSWYYDDIMKAVSAGYINGYDDGSMKPEETLTREEAAKIITVACKLDNSLPEGIHGFKDVDQMSKWAIVYIHILTEKGYMSGYDDGYFRPQALITRGETASILANIRRQELSDYDIFKEASSSNYLETGYSIQVGSFGNYRTAQALRDSLLKEGFEDSLLIKYPENSMYTVLAASCLTYDEARALELGLKNLQIDSFITNRQFRELDIVAEDRGRIPVARPIPKGPAVKEPSAKPAPRPGSYSVQAGTFSTIEGALELRKQLVGAGFRSSQIYKFKNQASYLVIVESQLDKARADSLRGELIRLKFDSFVTSKDLAQALKI